MDSRVSYMGGASRALVVGFAIGSLPANNGVFGITTSAVPRLRAANNNLLAATEAASEACGFRVTISGEAGGACRDGVGCSERPVRRQADRVQAFVGGASREAEIYRAADTSAWREVLDFGCVDRRDSLVFTVYDDLLGSLATCEVGQVASADEGGCDGAQGAQFFYMVEYINILPMEFETPLVPISERMLQLGTDTSAPSSTPDTPDTPSPIPEVTETDAPSIPETDAPIAVSTPAPTPEVTDEPTPAPQMSATTAPVEPPTAEPVAATVAPTEEPTPEPTPALTPAPVLPTPEPETPAPTAATTAPVGTPPTSRPVSPADPTPSPVTPDPPTISPTTAPSEPTASPERIDMDTAAPAVVEQPPTLGPTPAPASVTAAPALSPSGTPAPTPTAVGTPTPGPSSPAPVISTTPAPVGGGGGVETSPPNVAEGATLSPSTSDLCTDSCVGSTTASPYTGSYYDYRCDGGTELTGCNLDSTFLDCRRCYINQEMYEDENGVDDAWPECPCCAWEDVDDDVLSEECLAELGVSTPAPTSTSEEVINLSTSANDPDLMMISFNEADCTASGIAIIDNSGTKVMEVTRYASAEDGSCGEDFLYIFGTVCEADNSPYTWSYGSGTYSYSYTCDDEAGTSSRRRLAETTVNYDSATLLCNNGDRFVVLANLEGEDEGLVYARSDATGFDAITSDVSGLSGGDYCDEDVKDTATTVLVNGVDNVLENPDESSSEGDGISLVIIISTIAALVLLMLCGCLCCYRHRKGKEGRADQMRRNLGYTPDMEAKGEGNFGPTNKHVAITRGGGAQVTPEMLATTTYRQTYPMHQRAPSEAPSSVIEDNIANNYRPKTAAKNWEKRKVHKELTKPASQQHVIGAGPTSEELKTENAVPGSQSARSEQLSEHSLTQLDLSNSNKSGAHAPPGQAQYGYAFEDVEGDDDDDARSAATGMSGPSKYAPSGYAPSSHHDGVTHDLMSQYEPSVYEADSQYDPSLYGRESEYADESNYSYNQQDSRPSQRGGYGYQHQHGGSGRGRGGVANSVSGRASVADTAAMSHLGSVMEMDDGGDNSSAYAPSESYVSSYVSSEDDDGRPARSIHPRVVDDGRVADDGRSSPNGGYSNSRHNAHRSGREVVSGGRSGFSASSAGGSSRHGGGRSGHENESRDYDDEEDDSVMHDVPVSMEDLEYYSEDNPSSRGAPLTDVDERHGGQRW